MRGFRDLFKIKKYQYYSLEVFWIGNYQTVLVELNGEDPIFHAGLVAVYKYIDSFKVDVIWLSSIDEMNSELEVMFPRNIVIIVD